ncbi:MAG: hypothetical protein OXI01_17080 [Albidovulum sp.]|nr:hypothetical protein [Albidovulum sp.]
MRWKARHHESGWAAGIYDEVSQSGVASPLPVIVFSAHRQRIFRRVIIGGLAASANEEFASPVEPGPAGRRAGRGKLSRNADSVSEVGSCACGNDCLDKAPDARQFDRRASLVRVGVESTWPMSAGVDSSLGLNARRHHVS